MDEYRADYPKKPMGGNNPYWCCASCGMTDPEINGDLDGHYSWCKWMLAEKRKESRQKPLQ